MNKQRIDSLWMAISTDMQGDGVCAVILNGTWVPLIAADEERLVWIRAMAQEIIDNGIHDDVRLIKLTTREEVETFVKREPS